MSAPPYASRHMSWLHCMWGLGASIGPYVMGLALTGGQGWNGGYRYIALLQILLTAILLCSLSLWKKRPDTDGASGTAVSESPLTLRDIWCIPGTKAIMLTFFCYCAAEQTTGLWAGSYLTLHWGLAPETAASFASLFYVGITAGRAISGFLTIKWNDAQMVRLGEGITMAGILTLLLPFGAAPRVGLFLIGLGCAPIYPCIIHATPRYFGADRSQAIIGVQMACAYAGTCLMPPVFGLIAQHITVALLPIYLLALVAVMAVTHEVLLQKYGRSGNSRGK